MYIVEGRRPLESRLGEPRAVNLRLGVKPLRFLNLDGFEVNKHSLTPGLSGMVDHLVNHVTASWNTNRPITVIRLIGHTDITGRPDYNVRLGNKRAEAIKAALQSRLTSFMNRVLIVVDPSPGKTKPIADNRTNAGRRGNRRVEVFVEFRVAPSSPSPPPKPCLDPRRCIKLPEDSVIITKPGPYGGSIPPGRPGKSTEQWLDSKLARLPKSVAWAIKKAFMSGSCAAVGMALGSVVGGLSDSEKQEITRECEARWKKPI